MILCVHILELPIHSSSSAAGPTIRAGSDPAKDAAVNFCVRSGAATSMSLCLLRSGGGYMEIAMDPVVNRTGEAWHVLVGCTLDDLLIHLHIQVGDWFDVARAGGWLHRTSVTLAAARAIRVSCQ